MASGNSNARPTRREFLLALGTSAAAIALAYPTRADSPIKVKIAKIESFPIIYPVVGRFRFFEGPPGQPAGRAAVVVKITADNGAVGWGQSVLIPKWSCETLETVHSTLTRHLAPELLGRDPFDLEGIHAAMNRAIAPSFYTGQPICKAGVELALFDLTGKLLKQSASQLWDRKGRDRITLSWTLNPRALDEVEPPSPKAGRAAIGTSTSRSRPTRRPFEVKNGELAVPTGRGLGVEVDEAKLREMSVRSV